MHTTLRPTFERRRHEFRRRTDCRFIEPTAYCDLLVSRRALRRADDAGAQLRGLFDPTDGLCYLVEEEKLR